MTTLRSKLQRSEVVLGTMATLPSPEVTRVLASCGLDWIGIDLEHGPIGIGVANQMIQATAGCDCASLVRIPDDNLQLARPALDSGACGLIVPMVKTGKDVASSLEYMRYPPLGARGVGPALAALRWRMSVPEYLAAANDALTGFFLIEQIDAVENLDEILSMQGVDAAIIAPFDLSASMGRTGQLDHPDVASAIARAEAKILESNVALGGLALTEEDARTKRARGYRVITLSYDVQLLQSQLGSLVQGLKEA
ncbi:MAG: aldolase/citrate lyase family protein [Pseudomonadota bacterium]